MPMVIPLVVAAFEVYGAATAIATVGLTLASGLTLAAGVFTAAGALTGNKDLSMIGGVLGLGGGLASLSDSASGIGAGANEHGFNQAADSAAADTVGDAATTTAGQTAGETAGATPLPSSPPVMDTGLISNASTPAAQAAASTPATAAQPLAGTPSSTLAGEAAPQTVEGGIAAPAAPTVNAPTAPVAPSVPGTQPAYAGPGTPGAGAGSDAISDGSGAGWLDTLKAKAGGAVDWMKANPELTKVGAGLINGAGDYYGKQNIANSNVQRTKDYQDWVRQRYSDSVRNLTIPGVQVSKAPSSGIVAGARG